MSNIESPIKSGRGQVGPPPPAAGSIRHPARHSFQQKTSDKKTSGSLVTVKELAAELGMSTSSISRLLIKIRIAIGPIEPLSNAGKFYRPAMDQRLREWSFCPEHKAAREAAERAAAKRKAAKQEPAK